MRGGDVKTLAKVRARPLRHDKRVRWARKSLPQGPPVISISPKGSLSRLFVRKGVGGERILVRPEPALNARHEVNQGIAGKHILRRLLTRKLNLDLKEAEGMTISQQGGKELEITARRGRPVRPSRTRLSLPDCKAMQGGKWKRGRQPRDREPAAYM